MTGESRALYEPDVLRVANRATGYVYVRGDERGTIVFANETAERMFGAQFGELEGKSVDTLLPDPAALTHPAFRATFLANPSIRPMGTGRQLYGKRKDGSTFPIIVALAPAYSGNELHVLAMITELIDAPPVAAEGS